MNGDNLQSKIASILKGTKIAPLEPEVSGKLLDILHSQTEQGTIARNGVIEQTPPKDTIASLSGVVNDKIEEKKPLEIKPTQAPIVTPPTAVAAAPVVSPAPSTPPVVTATPTSNLPKDFLQKPIKTYENDVAEALSKKGASVVKIAIAENEKKTGTEGIKNKEPSKIGRNLLKAVISLILIVAGLGGGYYLYSISPLAKQPAVKVENKIASVIAPDTQKMVAVNSLKKQEFTNFISSEFTKYNAGAGKILELVPMQGEAKITASQFLVSLDFDITDTLKRSLTDKWMLGIYETGGEKIPFILLTNNFFQNSYAGMLKWEATMPDEFADLLNYKDKAYAVDPTSTTSVATYFNVKGQWEDRIIKNRDIREFIGASGQILLLYSFIDKDTIVITTSEAIIPALIERIEKQTYVR